MYLSSNLSRARNAHVQRWKNSNLLISSSFASLKEIMAILATQAAAKKPGELGASAALKTLVMPKNPGQPNRSQAGGANLESIWKNKLRIHQPVQKFEVDAPVQIRFESSIPPGAGSTIRETMKKLAERAKAKAYYPTNAQSCSNPAMKHEDIKMSSHDVVSGIAVPTDPSSNTALLSVQPKKRGRPPKKLGGTTTSSLEIASDVTVSNNPHTNITILPVQPKKRGRPPKIRDGAASSSPEVVSGIAVPTDLSTNVALLSAQPKKRGRPAKIRNVARSLQDVASDVSTLKDVVVAPQLADPKTSEFNQLVPKLAAQAAAKNIGDHGASATAHINDEMPTDEFMDRFTPEGLLKRYIVARAGIRGILRKLEAGHAKVQLSNAFFEKVHKKKQRNKQHVLHSEVDAPVPTRFDSCNPAAAAGASNSKTTLDQAETYSIRTYMAYLAKKRREKGEPSIWEKLDVTKPLPEFNNISSPATSNGTWMA